MIGRLSGTLLEKHPPQLLVDVQGVGYELESPMSTFYQLPAIGESVVLHIHMVVREDAQLLYAFYSQSERQLFRDLIKINGVGPKLALTILSGVTAEEFTRCVMENDAKALTALPGVGKKTAERLIIELRDRLAKNADAILPGAGSVAGLKVEANPVSDAVSALVSLGYKAQEASQMVRVVETEGLTTEDIIKVALKGMVKK
ncbi:MAG: Holliday junction branch migration protein RuvA [Gammaproteobacteria bacterium]|nr:Holliday junction branch migration protein RuvA [Gammaproteobacteria bacterium]MCK5262081.1 Holliday junction branch migration protein RuvA [Gammaproteobacteria bacterium]